MHSYGPFGEGNRLPQFRTKCKITPERELSGGLHFACSATIGTVKMKASNIFHFKQYKLITSYQVQLEIYKKANYAKNTIKN